MSYSKPTVALQRKPETVEQPGLSICVTCLTVARVPRNRRSPSGAEEVIYPQPFGQITAGATGLSVDFSHLIRKLCGSIWCAADS